LYPNLAPSDVSVNLSGLQFSQPDLVAVLAGILEETGLKPEELFLELSETMILEEPSQAAGKLAELKDLGVGLAIDDFGTGYSSLSRLAEFPVDRIKLDHSFVHGLGIGSGTEVVRAILALARTMRMRVVAEGVETAAQAKVLQELGCEYGQGEFFAPPMAPAAQELRFRSIS